MYHCTFDVLLNAMQVTVYVGKRDFVDHVLEVDPIGQSYYQCVLIL